ncbi:MAG: hypothetical protein KC418_21455 [Anaerolineales bacterium]|nr:hypothetical protein [Anaerolineales bacterium]MCB8954694.1 hypothetical protein [Ardenticatenales bacterium]
MEQEIDLEKYVLLLLRGWKWVLGAALLLAVVAFLISTLLPATYEATTLMSTSRTRFDLEFESRFKTVEDYQNAFRAFPELAMSDQVLESLSEQIGLVNNQPLTLAELRTRLAAELGADVSLIRLHVRGKESENVAAWANMWAAIFVESANEVYGLQPAAETEFLTSQLAQVSVELEMAEQALIDAQQEDRVAVLRNQLDTDINLHRSLLGQQNDAQLLLQDIQRLRDQIATQPAGSGVGSLSNPLTTMLLQIKAYGAATDIPVFLQVGSDVTAITQMPASAQIATLDGLSQALQTQMSEADAQLTTLETQILAEQVTYQTAVTEQARLQRTYDLTKETYMTVARKMEEVKISTQDQTQYVRLASEASPPTEPISPKRMLNTFIGAVLGGLAGVLFLFLREWRRALMRR